MYPRELKFSMPAEWAPHTRTLISWPVQDSMVYPEDYEAVCQGYAETIRAIAEFEPVAVVVNPDDLELARRHIGEGERIEFLQIPHNDAWLRDNGPTFVATPEGEVAGINWQFNAWGGKYSPWDLDDAVAPQLLEHYGIRRFDAPLILEGGSIHSDGEGTILTTRECLLNPNRNKGMSQEQIEEELARYLSARRVIWLNNGLFGDETDGHVDNVACFAAPGKVLMQVCDDPEDENYAITQENLAILREATDAEGRPIEVLPIQQPPKTFYKGKRLTLSYLNFYFVNGGIILPVFGGEAAETDRLAEEALQRAFPNLRIRTVNGMAIIREGGNVHCTTQQMAAGAR
ncbi:agmatine deiminase family protein [Paenibacillus sp. J31TS4]|uniref:agmatine deiminase family protein n=1 Tax=Paenibacillus sp. J31TS4 TaxID=2807195 RepID=UPI001BCDBB2C|nr:agmatine deiminase family protein [Paenibacillus sp. J31TS4]